MCKITTMTMAEIKAFRKEYIRQMSGNLTAEEKRIIKERQHYAKQIEESITRNCGGKNPILGY